MINSNSLCGRAVLVFFWGGLAASFVTMIYSAHPFNPYFIAWLVVLFNIVFVTIKNILIPPASSERAGKK